MQCKALTQKSYQATAKEYAHNVADLAPLESIDTFISLLPPHAKMIDIGCGSGRDAKLFIEKGLSVVGIDFSSNLIDIAKANAPLAEFHVMDIEAISLPPSSFDGAWAAASLLHIPKKALPPVLEKIHSLLKEKGHFYLSLKKGVGETLEKDARYEECEKFWSYFEEEELRGYLQTARFKILSLCTIEKWHSYHTHPFFQVFCQKK